MRAQTRHSLKEDRFRGATIVAAERTAHWTVEHKNTLITASVVLAAVLALGLGGWTYVSHQDEKASLEFGQAIRTLQTPVRPAGVPEQPGFPSFASPQERATAARKQFQQVLDKYPHTHTADMARYFVGVTSADLGDNAAAERYLAQVASLHNDDLAALGKLALASVYRKENKDGQAIDLYKQLINKPTRTVGKVTAQMEMADLYQAKQQPGDAKRIYEQIQKENPASEAASLASSKLAELK
ncbi:MAG TPA: tetratricopeptide repeat protein [Terriglobales bacterium]|nr:tetratricopeptide repeat protein [Terriglobales bacterium]